MPTQDEYIASSAEKLKDRAHGDMVEFGMFMAKGTLFANGAALLACYTAFANAHVCQVQTFSIVVWLFVIGFLFGGAGLGVGYYAGMTTLQLVAHQAIYAANVLASGATEEAREQARSERDKVGLELQKFGKVWPTVIQALHVAGVFFFIAGIVAPLLNRDIANAICHGPN